MRYRECRHEVEKPHSKLFVMSFFCVFVCAVALGSLRLYGLYLEHKISEASSQIEMFSEENTELSRRYSELLSPASVYSYAREQLSMANAEHVETVKVDGGAVVMAKAGGREVRGMEENMIARLNPFVRKAHAEN